jgi:hypothetical protein
MNDRLDRALRALREEETGTNPKSEATLDRILASRRGTSVTWGKRARMWVPIAAVLVVATTALARSGSMASVRALLRGRTEVVPVRKESGVVPVAPVASAADPESTSLVEVPRAEPAPSDTPPAVLLPSAPALASRVTPTLASRPAPTSARAPATVTSAAPATATPSPSTAPAPSESEPSSAGVVAEADVYARAHRLHFDGADPRAALAAWDDYLIRYPGGRFAPDARYNRAIDLLKMRKYAEARAALQPFADGSFGGYHREDARELLRSIP